MNGGQAFRAASKLTTSGTREHWPRAPWGLVFPCLLAGALALLGCAGPPPRSALPAVPLEESRAIQVIAAAFTAEGEPPSAGKFVELDVNKLLQLDVQAKEHKFAVAYLTQSERAALGKALPPRDPAMSDALQLVSGAGEHADVRVLVLYDFDYMYDDRLGGLHSASTITAERKLERDVRDFLVRAHAEAWP